ncbi:MAG: hypothetical protein U9N30_04120 [Campylobacterota bacterium]|nr:hypothetical protein [Campylobacterota bacterium]
MHKKSVYVLYLLLGLTSALVAQVVYLNSSKSITPTMHHKKNSFVKLTGLPDLAISTEASYIRHRSLTDLSSIYKDDPMLREYFPSTFTYSHSHIHHKTSSKGYNAQ